MTFIKHTDLLSLASKVWVGDAYCPAVVVNLMPSSSDLVEVRYDNGCREITMLSKLHREPQSLADEAAGHFRGFKAGPTNAVDVNLLVLKWITHRAALQAYDAWLLENGTEYEKTMLARDAALKEQEMASAKVSRRTKAARQ